jgi:hypothetical protein
VNRRECITLVGGAAAALPFAAQRSSEASWQLSGGWTDGRNTAIQYRGAEGRNERAAHMAA